MRIIYSKYGIDLCLEENKITTIVIENPLVMSEVIRNICQIRIRFFLLKRLVYF